MIRVLRILKQNGFDGIITPDHTPQMSCGGWHAGKAHSLGWIRAALMAIEGEGLTTPTPQHPNTPTPNYPNTQS